MSRKSQILVSNWSFKKFQTDFQTWESQERRKVLPGYVSHSAWNNKVKSVLDGFAATAQQQCTLQVRLIPRPPHSSAGHTSSQAIGELHPNLAMGFKKTAHHTVSLIWWGLNFLSRNYKYKVSLLSSLCRCLFLVGNTAFPFWPLFSWALTHDLARPIALLQLFSSQFCRCGSVCPKDRSVDEWANKSKQKSNLWILLGFGRKRQLKGHTEEKHIGLVFGLANSHLSVLNSFTQMATILTSEPHTEPHPGGVGSG